MAIPLRYLIRRALAPMVAALACAFPALHAAPPPPSPATFQLYSPMPLGDLFYDLEGRPVPVYVGHHTFSDPVRVPATGAVNLYRLKPASEPNLPPVRVTVVSASASGRDGAQSLVLIYPEGPPPHDEAPDLRPLRTLVLDQSKEAFAPGTIRVFSFSSRPAAVKIGATAVPVPPMQIVSVPYPDDQRTWLHIATVGEQGWQRVIGSPQSLGSNTRLSLFLRDIPPSRYDPRPVGLLLGKIIEFMPAPAAE